MTTPDVQDLVAPVVMISACGVLMIAASTRAANVMSQVHSMHRERVELFARLHRDERGPTPAERVRAEGLELLTHSMLVRARWLRLGMVGIVLCVVMMLLCSGALAFGGARAAAVPLFVAGAAALLAAMGAHLVELARSLTEARLEHERSERFRLPPEDSPGAE